MLWCVWRWVTLSDADYRAGDIAGGRTTGGWFVLGLPFNLVAGLLASLLFSFVARRTRPLVGWSCLLAVFIPLIVIAFVQTTPAARLRSALDIELPAGTLIQRIGAVKTFHGGGIFGVCSADSQFVDQLVAVHALTPSDSRAMLLQMMPDESIPEDGKVFTGGGLFIFYDADRSLLLFIRHLGQPRP